MTRRQMSYLAVSETLASTFKRFAFRALIRRPEVS
jgi:hypothetical protein